MYWIDGETLSFFVLLLLMACCTTTMFALRGRNRDGSAGWGKLFFALLLILGVGTIFCIGNKHEYWAILGSTIGIMVIGIAVEPSRTADEKLEI